MKPLCTFIVGMAMVSVTTAQNLQWEQTTAAIEAPEGGGAVSGAFQFTNAGDQTIRVRAVPVSCSCVKARAVPSEIAPGGQSEIHFTYSPRGRWGTRAYRILVSTDEEGVRPYQLRLEVTETRRNAEDG